MQISGLPVIPPQASQNRRADVVERDQRDVDVNREEDETSRGQSLEARQFLAEDFFQQRVESSSTSDSIAYRQQAETSNLPLNTQKALQAFKQNAPSPEQQLGIELVGVDLYA